MIGRPLKTYTPMYHAINLKTGDLTNIPFGEILVLCPVCYSDLVGPYGYQISKTGEWPKFQCKNPECPALKYLKKGKQFVLKTSAIFKNALSNHLTKVIESLVRGDTTQTAIGRQHHRSSALMTFIRHKVEDILDYRHDLEKLVVNAPMGDAVSIDEMFLNINGESVYVIMATSYGKKNVLGVKVSLKRDECMMRAVFDEAERNNGKSFSLITIDAWGASIKMAKELRRPITLVIHKHKTPYNKAIVWKFEYSADKRIIHKIGMKTDFFRKRKTREYYYMKEEEDLTKCPPKKRGRPKGIKNGQGKGSYVKIPKKDQKPRGKKGIFMVFDKGKRGYAHVDPGRNRVRIAKGGSNTVTAVLNQVILIFGKMTIQNNLAENKNSVVEHRVWCSGPKNISGFEKRLRTFLFFSNNLEELPKLQINHHLRGDMVFDELKSSIFGDIIKQNYQFQKNLTKLEVLN
jgi:hypothetical protein